MRAFVAFGLAVALFGPACSVKKVRFRPLSDASTDGKDAAPPPVDGGHQDAAGMDAPAQADAATPDAAHDAMAGDAAARDAAVPDAATHDAATRDAAAHDAGSPDAAVRDAAPIDASLADAGGSPDAHDAGPADGPPPTCATSLVPAMTSPTTPSGAVFSSGSYDATSYDAWQAFDASSTSMWISPQGQSPAFIGYAWDDGPRSVLAYAITYANGSILTRAPSAWSFEGLYGDAWIVLDVREGEFGWAGFERRVYTLAEPGLYSQYRLNITDDNDPTDGIVVISMGRLELLGCPPSAPGQAR